MPFPHIDKEVCLVFMCELWPSNDILIEVHCSYISAIARQSCIIFDVAMLALYHKVGHMSVISLQYGYISQLLLSHFLVQFSELLNSHVYFITNRKEPDFKK